MAKKRRLELTTLERQAAPKVEIWADGSCWPNPNGWGGWAAVIQFIDRQKIVSGGAADTTNNRMEIFAAIGGIRALTRPCHVTIYSDSLYLINSMQGRWRKNANKDLWRQLDKLHRLHVAFHWRWVRGHADDINNILADELAGKARDKFMGKHAEIEDITVEYEPLPSMEYPRA